MKKKYVSSILGLLLLILATGCAAPTAPLVTRVIDGDTIEVDIAGTILRYVYVDDILVNAKLVRQGLAWAKTYEPDIKYQETLEKAEAEAKQDKVGLWAPPTIPPSIPPVENIQITYIFYDGLVPRVESDEYVEITNVGDQPQELTGCMLMDIS